MKMRFAVLAVLAALAALPLAGPALAQAPRGAAVTTLGTHKVTIDYGRQALKGRDLDVLMKALPADRIWRGLMIARWSRMRGLSTSGDFARHARRTAIATAARPTIRAPATVAS